MNCIVHWKVLNFRIVYPNDREDLLKLIEITRLWWRHFRLLNITLSFGEEISKLNEYMPLYAFRQQLPLTSPNDPRMQVRFFEYALGVPQPISGGENSPEYR